MSESVIKIEGVGKQYVLGLVGANTLSADLKRMWSKLRGKEDPTLSISEENTLQKVGGKYVWALKDINFEVKRGEVLGIIGKNGAGKSTLLKLLSKVTAPTTGEIKYKGRISSLLEVGTGFHPELTGRENIYLNGAILGMDKAEISSKMDQIVAFSGIGKYIDTPVKRYSSGMYVRLAFAVASHLDSDILIIDEVLAVGDSEFQERCIGKMKDVADTGRTVLFVSHNMETVNSLCDRCILLSQGGVVADGLPKDIVKEYLSINNSAEALHRVFEGEDTLGDDHVQMKEARLINESFEDADALYVNKNFGIEVTYEVKSEMKPLPVINFYSLRGELLFTNPSSVDPQKIQKGINKLVVWFPSNYLNNQKYIISMEMMTYKPVLKQHFAFMNMFTIDVMDDVTADSRVGHESLYGRGVLRPFFKWERL